LLLLLSDGLTDRPERKRRGDRRRQKADARA
jgi:hypothetical protein